MIVAIDGPAGAGKSTVARAVAQRLGFEYLDTGALYRAVALVALESGVTPEDGAALATLADGLDLKVEGTEVLVGGRDVSAEIRSPEVTSAVALVAAQPAVRASLVPLQRSVAKERDAIVEGRDIGTAVFPDAEVKIFLTASEAERARRRARDMNLPDDEETVGSIRADIAERDSIDSSRRISPLARAEGSIEVDTSNMTFDEVVEEIVSIVRRTTGSLGG